MQDNKFYTKLVSLVEAHLKRLDEHVESLKELLEKAQEVKRGDSVSWNSSGGTARGKVTKVIKNGSENVPNSSFTITGTPEDPAALIRVYKQDSDNKYKPTDTIVGHKVKTLKKIDSLD